MGLQRNAQYRILLNLQKSGLVQVRGGTFDISFIDHMLCIYSFTNGVVLSMSSEDAIRMIADKFASHYQGISIETEYLVLCADGIKCPKPAVRHQRDKQVMSDVIKFTLANVSAINTEMMKILSADYESTSTRTVKKQRISEITEHTGIPTAVDEDDESINNTAEPKSPCYVPPHKRNFSTEVGTKSFRKTPKIVLLMGPRVWDKFDTCTIVRTNFAGDHPFGPNILRNCYCESDVYMFTIAKRLHHEGKRCAVISKDSDVVGTLLCSDEPTNITVFFQTNQHSFTKDFDCYFQHRIESVVPTIDSCRIPYKTTLSKFGNNVLLMMLDTLDVSPFPGLINIAEKYDTMLKKEFTTPESVDAVYQYLYSVGVRGPLFRRLAARTVTMNTGYEFHAIRELMKTATETNKLNKLGSITRVVVKRLFAESTAGFVVDATVYSKTAIDQDGFSMVTKPDFNAINNVIVNPYTDADKKRDDLLCGSRHQLMKAYACRVLLPDTYGQYLLFNMGNGANMVGVKINPNVPFTRIRAAGAMCVMSGTDYNLTVPKIGKVGVLHAWMDKHWEDFAIKLMTKQTAGVDSCSLDQSEGSDLIKRYMKMAALPDKQQKLVSVEMQWCIERTTMYVLDLWACTGLRDYKFYCLKKVKDGLEYDMNIPEFNDGGEYDNE